MVASNVSFIFTEDESLIFLPIVLANAAENQQTNTAISFHSGVAKIVL